MHNLHAYYACILCMHAYYACILCMHSCCELLSHISGPQTGRAAEGRVLAPSSLPSSRRGRPARGSSFDLPICCATVGVPEGKSSSRVRGTDVGQKFATSHSRFFGLKEQTNKYYACKQACCACILCISCMHTCMQACMYIMHAYHACIAVANFCPTSVTLEIRARHLKRSLPRGIRHSELGLASPRDSPPGAPPWPTGRDGGLPHIMHACISCMHNMHHNMHAHHACIPCMHINANYACMICMHDMHAYYACIICMHDMRALSFPRRTGRDGGLPDANRPPEPPEAPTGAERRRPFGNPAAAGLVHHQLKLRDVGQKFASTMHAYNVHA